MRTASCLDLSLVMAWRITAERCSNAEQDYAAGHYGPAAGQCAQRLFGRHCPAGPRCDAAPGSIFTTGKKAKKAPPDEMPPPPSRAPGQTVPRSRAQIVSSAAGVAAALPPKPLGGIAAVGAAARQIWRASQLAAQSAALLLLVEAGRITSSAPHGADAGRSDRDLPCNHARSRPPAASISVLRIALQQPIWGCVPFCSNVMLGAVTSSAVQRRSKLGV